MNSRKLCLITVALIFACASFFTLRHRSKYSSHWRTASITVESTNAQQAVHEATGKVVNILTDIEFGLINGPQHGYGGDSELTNLSPHYHDVTNIDISRQLIMAGAEVGWLIGVSGGSSDDVVNAISNVLAGDRHALAKWGRIAADKCATNGIPRKQIEMIWQVVTNKN